MCIFSTKSPSAAFSRSHAPMGPLPLSNCNVPPRIMDPFPWCTALSASYAFITP